MLVGWGGNNGNTVMATILANTEIEFVVEDYTVHDGEKVAN